MTPPSPSAPAAPVSLPLGLRLEDGGGITPFWRVMIALTGLGMVALAALLLLTCSWAKPKHLIVGKVSPTRTAGEALPSTQSATSPAAATGGEEVRPQAAEQSARGSRGGGLPRGSREHGVARPGTVLKRSARKPGFASGSRGLGSSERLPKQSCSCTSCGGAVCGSVEAAEGLYALQMPQERRGSSGTRKESNTGSCCTTSPLTTPSPAGSARAARSVVTEHPPPQASHTPHPAYTQPTPSPIAVRERSARSRVSLFVQRRAPQAALGGSTHAPTEGEIRGRSRRTARSEPHFHASAWCCLSEPLHSLLFHRRCRPRPQACDPFAVLEGALVGAAMLSGVGALLPTDAEMHPPPASTAERGAESHGSSGAGRGPGPQTGSQRTDAPEAPAERSPSKPRPVDAPAPALNWWEEPDWWLGPNRSSPHQAAGVGYSSAPGRAGGAAQVGRPIYVACVCGACVCAQRLYGCRVRVCVCMRMHT